MADEPQVAWADLGDQIFKVDDGDDRNGPKKFAKFQVDPAEEWPPGVAMTPLTDGRSAIAIHQPHAFQGRAEPTAGGARRAQAFTSFLAFFAPLVPSGPRPVTATVKFGLTFLELSPGGFAEIGFRLYRSPARKASDLVVSWSGRYTFSGVALSGLSLSSPPGAPEAAAPEIADGTAAGVPKTRDEVRWPNVQPDDYAFLATFVVEQPQIRAEHPLEDTIGFSILLDKAATEAVLEYELILE